jgi:hypothetical protein
MLRKIVQQVLPVPELQLVPVQSTPRQNNWLPAFAHDPDALDTACWQTRGARGLSWNPGGKLLARRSAARRIAARRIAH